MSPKVPFIVGIGGTTRDGSSSEQAMVSALRHAETLGAEIAIHAGSSLLLPMYDPAESIPEAAQRLVTDLRRADGVILSSPCYHGGVSGLIKNALDYTEDMRNDARVYFDGVAVGSIACGYGYQGPSVVLSQLRQIVHALRGWNVPLGVGINSLVVKFSDYQCSDPGIEKQLKIMAEQIVGHAHRMMHFAAQTPVKAEAGAAQA